MIYIDAATVLVDMLLYIAGTAAVVLLGIMVVGEIADAIDRRRK